MTDALGSILALMAGGVLGAVFYGGLWWTVTRGLPSREPALWFLGSLVLRTSVVVAGFCLVSRGHWDRTLMCLIGFVIARLIATRLPRQGGLPGQAHGLPRQGDYAGTMERTTRELKEVDHAP